MQKIPRLFKSHRLTALVVSAFLSASLAHAQHPADLALVATVPDINDEYTLSWNPHGSSAFKIQERLDGGNWELLPVNYTESSFDVTGNPAGVYDYRFIKVVLVPTDAGFISAYLGEGATVTVDSTLPDADSDGIEDSLDNCPDDANPDQLDTDNDTEGDACDTDDDGDQFSDNFDNCPLIVNPDQLDTDYDFLGDVCDSDDDGDGVDDEFDACPLDSSASTGNNDDDDVCDLFDIDDDNDGVWDIVDACPFDPTGFLNDNDGDGICDVTDEDDDNDGYADINDAFMFDSSEWLDTDGDGIGNNLDLDDDNDGMSDIYEKMYGLNSLVENVAGDDFDGDTIDDLSEFAAGSDPSLSSSRPQLAIHSFATNATLTTLSAIQAGRPIILTWDTWGADTVTLTNDVDLTPVVVTDDGSIELSPAQTTTYTLTVTKAPAEEIMDTIKILFDTAPPASRWSSSLNDESLINTSITVTDTGVSYVGSLSSHLYKIDISGEQIWELEDSGRIVGKVLLLDNNIIYGADTTSEYIGIIASYTSDKILNWRHPTDSPVMASPIANDEGTIIYAVDFDGTVYALDNTTGDLLWKWQRTDAQVVAAPILTADGKLIIVKSKTEIFAVEIAEAQSQYEPETVGGMVATATATAEPDPPIVRWNKVFGGTE